MELIIRKPENSEIKTRRQRTSLKSHQRHIKAPCVCVHALGQKKQQQQQQQHEDEDEDK
jgi:hypothetical protein